MSSKTLFASVVAVFVGATVMLTGQSFAASTRPTPAPARETAAPAPVDTPRTSRPREAKPTPATDARRATPVRTTPRFTG